MRNAEWKKQWSPFLQRIRQLRKEMAEAFNDHSTDDEDPLKRVSERQAETIDAALEALTDAEQYAGPFDDDR